MKCDGNIRRLVRRIGIVQSTIVRLRRDASTFLDDVVVVHRRRSEADENDDRDDGDVVMPHNAVVLNDMMEDSLPSILRSN